MQALNKFEKLVTSKCTLKTENYILFCFKNIKTMMVKKHEWNLCEYGTYKRKKIYYIFIIYL